MITNLAMARGAEVRRTLLTLRLAGLPLKECATVVGLKYKGAEYEWLRIRQITGRLPDMALAAWAATTPRKKWNL